jgi:AcrR family transcriptional regulator
MVERALSRSEAKSITRRRLLDAAIQILDEEGEAGLTTTAVTRMAGIAQSSFYVHFTDLDDLLHVLIEDLAAERQRRTREARKLVRATPSAEHLRETFRIPLADLITHARVFRLTQRARHDRSSPLGDWSRELLDATRQALIDDLHAAGMPSRRAVERRRASMVADGIIALTESLANGHLDGRYPDIEEIIDVLVAFSRGYFPWLQRPAKVENNAEQPTRRRSPPK